MTARTRRGHWLAAANAVCWAAAYSFPSTHSRTGVVDFAVDMVFLILSLPLGCVTFALTLSGGPSGGIVPTALLLSGNSLLWGQMASAVYEHVRSKSEVDRLADRRRRRVCPTCGYDLRMTPDRCPECGEVPTWAAEQRRIDAAVRGLEGDRPDPPA